MALKRKIKLEANEIQIHILRPKENYFLDPGENFLSLLPPEEQRKADEFELEERRREYLWSRLLLRRVLALVLGWEIRDLVFRHGRNGKPFLRDSKVNFNLSHTDGLIACSVALRKVGIDIEKTPLLKKSGKNWGLVARRFFSAEEKNYIFSKSPELQPGLFLKIFTLKEAVAKAEGGRLSRFLGSFTVPLTPMGGFAARKWECFTDILEPGGFCLAHAAEKGGGETRYRFFEWMENSLNIQSSPNPPFFEKWTYGHLRG